MEDIDVIKHRLETLESTTKQMYTEKMVMKGAINHLSETVDTLRKYVSDLEKKLSKKVDVTEIKQVVKRSELITKINDRKSIGMDCKVGVSLDGKVIAKSVVEHKTDGIKMTVTDIKGARINETN
ncbi:hypothetical protein [Bacillus sp. FDAARGOS_1420]|uniref:hypothetical protein n=1 Tax=unclassified Bacillus (in: firmicutes) TaxID=185979 RepID=UPI00214BA708|nr:hypothetical protein [Bacillus sp. FDAARGOS_1420]